MDLKILKSFVAVAEIQNITKAADMLYMTQPNLSRQIKELEDELKTTLLERGKRKTTLTEDGEILLNHAKQLLELEEKLQFEFMNRANTQYGRLTIGFSECLGARRIGKFINTFSSIYPNVTYEIYNGYAYDIIERINHGLTDLGVLLQPLDLTELDYTDIGQDETWGVLVCKDHPFATRKTISYSEIRNEKLIIPKRAFDQNALYDWFPLEANSVKILAKYNLFSSSIHLVENGMGVAICNKGALGIQNNPDVVFIPLHPKAAFKSILAWKKSVQPSPLASLFIKHVLESLKEDDKPNH